MTGDTPGYHTARAAACQRRIVSYVTSSDDNDLTIDELAREIGMTVRNIRAHQSRGLLPPPALRGRTGYYGAEHTSRLKLIQELQTEGFNLELIKRLLEGAGGSSGQVLRFKQALAQPFGGEEPEIVGIADLIAQWGTADPAMLMKSLSLGLLRQLPDGRFEVPSPRLAKAGRELQRLGVPLERSLEFTATVREHADRIAQIYVDLFLETVWTPFEQAGRPSEGWLEVQEALERLHPLASESLLAVFGMAMKSAVDRESARALKRMAGDGAETADSAETGDGADGGNGGDIAETVADVAEVADSRNGGDVADTGDNGDTAGVADVAAS
jgi:DNA-binding transcriptional MerR regulator